MSHKVFIGTSGWAYDWSEFFDEEVPKSRRLEYYSQYFNTAEVNYSFYRLPAKKTMQKWVEASDDNFLFALKLSRYLTHVKRLHQVKTSFKKFLRRYKHLKDKSGPILVQLPPNFKKDTILLESFLDDAESARKDLDLSPLNLAFEFRHDSWYDSPEETEAVLKKANAAWVLAHSSKYPYPENEPTTAQNFVYLRLHGPRELFASPYGENRLRDWSRLIKTLRQDRKVFVYFNNDKEGYAPKDALTLKKLLS